MDTPESIPSDRPSETSVTVLLQQASAGDRRNFDALFIRVYDELHRLASRVRSGRAGETMATTALVHEAYVKLLPTADQTWESRAHFFGVAARAMRQVLVDAARRRAAGKRGGGVVAVTLNEAVPVTRGSHEDNILALDEALQRLASIEPRAVQVVEQRFFAGLTTAETAAVLGVSTGTVERDWRAARAWLASELGVGA